MRCWKHRKPGGELGSLGSALRTPSWGNVSDQGRDCVYLGPELVTILWRVQCTAYKLAVTWLCYPSPLLISGCALALTLGTPPLDLRHAPPPFFGLLGKRGSLALPSHRETRRPLRADIAPKVDIFRTTLKAAWSPLIADGGSELNYG
jgi:hypothetical protein